MAYRTPMVFNNSTGDDNNASGIGPSTAVTGSAAYCAGSTTTIDLSYDTPDLSAVQVGDCIYIPTLSGTERCFLEIASVTQISYTITVTTTITNSFSFQSWAIGGKRAFGNSAAGRSPFDQNNTDGSFYQEYEIEYTGTDYEHSSGVTIYENASIVGTGSQMPKIVMTSNSQTMFNGHSPMVSNSQGLIANLWITNNGVAITTTAIDWNDESLAVSHCKIGHDTPTPVQIGIYLSGTKAGSSIYATEFYTSGQCCIGSGGSTAFSAYNSCTFTSTGNAGIVINNSSGISSVTNCTFTGCSTGINMSNCDRFFIVNNAFNDVSGIACYVNGSDTGFIGNNVFNDCGTGIDASSTVSFQSRTYGNYFNGCTTNQSADWDTNLMHNSNYDVALGGDPFVSATDTTLAGNSASDVLLDETTADPLTFEMSELRPFGHLNITGGGGGGGSVIVIEE